ncbi:hypothetical protein Goari_027413 [Gossypium aridum]|uniref:Uncharacterized protein n=1 Tax=Gossypium aridum TaxID=34290 RepID=A0A7J8YRD5_GOSAI|nr:hypothetical protein [Gossypium aridum]
MFKGIFRKTKPETNALTTLDKLNETLEMLEKKESVLLKKTAAEVEKAKEYAKGRNKKGMIAIYIHKWLMFFLHCKLHFWGLLVQSLAARNVLWTLSDDLMQINITMLKYDAEFLIYHVLMSCEVFIMLLYAAAIQCLKRKKLYEQQIEQLGNFQLRVHDQMIMLEGAKATTETVDTLRTGAAAMKAMQKATSIDDVDKTMDEINEQTENMKQIQEALSTPIGVAADFDEDELEAELEELEGAELEEQLLQPATTAPAAPVQVPASSQPARPVPQKRTAEEDELAALQAEMAL